MKKDLQRLPGRFLSRKIGEELTEKQFAFQRSYNQASSALIQKRIPFDLVPFKQLRHNFYYFKICYAGLSLCKGGVYHIYKFLRCRR